MAWSKEEWISTEQNENGSAFMLFSGDVSLNLGRIHLNLLQEPPDP